jgi:hypothetical protein
MFCTKCGQAVPSGARFCARCGATAANSLESSPGTKPPPTNLRPPKSGNGSRVLIGTATVLAVVVVYGLVSQQPRGISTDRETEPKVKYEVTSDAVASARASLTYRNASGGTEQRTVPLPWTLEFRTLPGTSVSVIAQKEQAGLDFLEAKIYVNGDLLQEAETSTPYGIASVSATVASIKGNFDSMTAAQHLERMKSALSHGSFEEAGRHYDAIPTSAAEKAQAKPLRQQIMRGLLVKWQEKFLRGQGNDVTVTDAGESLIFTDNTRDPTAHAHFVGLFRSAWGKHSEIADGFCADGFREVRLMSHLDSSSESYSLDCK